jgi:hypothetical protein
MLAAHRSQRLYLALFLDQHLRVVRAILACQERIKGEYS